MDSWGSCADPLKNRRLLQSRQKTEFNVLDSPNLLIEVLFDPVHSFTTHINTKLKSTKISTKFRKNRKWSQ